MVNPRILLNQIGNFGGENCFGFITGFGDSFEFVVVDFKKKKSVLRSSFPSEFARNFVDELVLMKNVFDGIVVDAFGLNVPSSIGYKNAKEFFRALKCKFEVFQIPFYFISEDNYLVESLMIASKPDISINQSLIALLPNIDGIISLEYKKTLQGLELKRRQKILIDFDALQNDDKEKRDTESNRINNLIIQGTSKPKKIVGYNSNSQLSLPKIVQSKKLIVVEKDLQEFQEKFVIKCCQHFLLQKTSKYHVVPTSINDVSACAFFGDSDNVGEVVIKIPSNSPLPISKTVEFSKSASILKIAFGNDDIKSIYLNEKCHKYRVTMEIDKNNFESYLVEGAIFPIIEELPKILENFYFKQHPTIAFLEDLSFILVPNEKRQFLFLESWDGFYGMNNNVYSFGIQKRSRRESSPPQKMLIYFGLLEMASLTSINNHSPPSKFAPSRPLLKLLRQQLECIKTASENAEITRIGIAILDEKYSTIEKTQILEEFKKTCLFMGIEPVFVK